MRNKLYYLSEITLGEQKLDDTNNKSVVEVLRTGQWNGSKGRFKITRQNLDNFVKHFEENVYGSDLQVNLSHVRQGEAAGWFIQKGLRRDGNRLLADIEWTDLGRDKLNSKRFKYFSAEIDFDHTNEETGKKTPDVLLGGALTNVPYIKGMREVTVFSEDLQKFLSDNSKNMELFKIYLAELTNADSVSKAEVARMQKLFATLSEEEQADVKEAKEAVEAKVEEENPAEGGEGGQEGTEKVEAAEGNVKELTETIKNQQKALSEMQTKLRLSETEKIVESVTLSEKRGVAIGIKEEDVKELTDLLMSVSPEKAEKIVALMQKVREVDFSERGHNSKAGDSQTQYKKVNGQSYALSGMDENEAIQKIASEKNISFAEAFDIYAASQA